MLWWMVLGLVLGSIVNRVADWLAQRCVNRENLPSGTIDISYSLISLYVLYQLVRRTADIRGIPRLWRRLLVELTSTGMCAYLWWRFGASPQFVALLTYGYLFLVIFIVDAETRFVPNLVLGAGAIIALILRTAYSTLPASNALTGALVGLGLFLPLTLIRKGAMGAGDVKLAGLIGLVAGFPAVITALATGVVLGGLGALVLILSGAKQRHDYVPYAPYLVVGCMVTLLRGAVIL